MNKEKWVAGIWAMIEQYEGNLKDKDTAYMEVSKTIVNKIDAEIRKPLEDEIERLKFENKNIQNAIKLVDEAKYTAQQDDIDFFVKQERQKVIAELLEWAKKEDNYHSKFDYGAQEVMHRIRQKLNEMIGER